MSISPTLDTTEAAILSRLINPDDDSLNSDAAEAILALKFSPADTARMGELAEKSQAGELDETERRELENYNHVGHLLALLKSKARKSLKKHGHQA